jgi:hypothetical protein
MGHHKKQHVLSVFNISRKNIELYKESQAIAFERRIHSLLDITIYA